MRLKQIKLAGFKSFVDPTAFDVPSRLVGVVGPNGCGKSNIIDAVRWVLGETRAGELRGESMQDVIFSGSDTRKPASRASVELVFENAAGRLGGPWASYAELSVRRILTRDGQSIYQINHQAVRRKDVHDLFLGTGLGPRAYAIIGQGTISRIIEARPEELRGFLEEAAGVSRYRERRRETENRLADTRDNLARVDDVRGELGGRIERLEKQAVVAQRFRALDAERADKQALLWLLRRDEAIDKRDRATAAIVEAHERLETVTADLRTAEAALESLRDAHLAAGDAVHGAQGAYYEASSEVGALESEIRRVADARAESTERLHAAQVQLDAARTQAERAEIDRCDAERIAEEADARAAMLEAEVETVADAVPAAERDAQRAAAALEAGRVEVAERQRAIDVAQARRRAAHDRLVSIDARAGRLEAERRALSVPDEAAEAAAAEASAQAEHAEQTGADTLAGLESGARAAEHERSGAHDALRGAQSRASQLDARLNGLRQLQERAAARGRLRPWLEKHRLDRLAPLWQRLRIESGWEVAVEAVLRERVGALALDALDDANRLLADAPPGRLAFFAVAAGDAAVAAPAGTDAPTGVPTDAGSLAARVRCTDPALAALVGDWLHGCLAIDDAGAALAERERLAPGFEYVTRAGHRIGRAGLQFHHADSEQDGLLARQHEIEALDTEVAEARAVVDESRERATQADAAAQALGRDLVAAREAHRRAVRDAATARVDAERIAQARARALATEARIAAELAEVESERAGQAEIAAQADSETEIATAELDEHREAVEAARLAAESAQAALAGARAALRDAERAHQQAHFELREAQGRIARADETRARAETDAARATEAIDLLRERLAGLSDETSRAALDVARARRDAAEAELAGVRERLDALAAELRAADSRRLELERTVEPMRARIQQLQLDEQAARLTAAQYAQQLLESGFGRDGAAETAGIATGSIAAGVAPADDGATDDPGRASADHSAGNHDGRPDGDGDGDGDDTDRDDGMVAASGPTAADIERMRAAEDALRARFDPLPKPSWLQGEVTRLQREIASLGPVNLAALEELEEARERLHYLDTQSADLNEAMRTLEDAIRRIDRETRELLRDTFERVDANFSTLFPQLFGGGQARLLLSGEEILDAGVQVIAQPPGKRNTSIHLLSGGEKALTATALVFALFQLNPAPFCLLDEVDAPLDDANTERYCRMVRMMSPQTQFVFITHNKIAMEFAEQLIGVTMQERGVSRIVAVDLEAAGRMAEAA